MFELANWGFIGEQAYRIYGAQTRRAAHLFHAGLHGRASNALQNSEQAFLSEAEKTGEEEQIYAALVGGEVSDALAEEARAQKWLANVQLLKTGLYMTGMLANFLNYNGYLDDTMLEAFGHEITHGDMVLALSFLRAGIDLYLNKDSSQHS